MSDYLNGTEFEIEQPDWMYHFNSASEILGRFIEIHHKDHVLEIGCNTGGVLLYASLQKPASLTGIDLFEDVLEVAKKNLDNNHVSAELICTPLQSYKRNKYYDVIFCNPPFFMDNQDSKENKYIKAAKYTSSLNVEELMKGVKSLLKDNGRFYMIIPSMYSNAYIHEASKYHLYPFVLQYSYEDFHKDGKHICIGFKFGKDSMHVRIAPPIDLKDRSTYPEIKK